MDTPQSWLVPALCWSKSEASFACRVSAESLDLVVALGAGRIAAPEFKTLLAAKVTKRLNLSPSSELENACCDWATSSASRWESRPAWFYLHDILAENDAVIVLLGGEPPQSPLPQGLRDLQAKATERQQQAGKALLLRDLEPELRPAILVQRLPARKRARAAAVLAAIANSSRYPARNGEYACSLVPFQDGSNAALVQWQERHLATPAPEVKAALGRCLKSAFQRPRRSGIDPPAMLVSETTLVGSGRLGDDDDLPDNGTLAESLPRDEGAAREAVTESGFEAIAWYQPFHCYDESSWGIYFHSGKLDELAAGLAADLPSEPRRHSLGALLALRLTMAHEVFHARVEFAAAWLELSRRRPRYLAYARDVYDRLRFTPNWREEALANFCAHEWLRGAMDSLGRKGFVAHPGDVLPVIEAWLDFSPEGYSRWRMGNMPGSWDRLASELTTAKPCSDWGVPSCSPLGGLLHENSCFDLRMVDVPVRFVGSGVIADALFSAPSRREVEQVLRRHSYQLLAGRGKGSHEVWGAPNGRVFTVPRRDPLSPGVFHQLLEHFGWSKHHYMQAIRPMI